MCRGCHRRYRVGLADPPDVMEVISKIPLSSDPRLQTAGDPRYTLTPTARIEPWVPFLEQEIIPGVKNKTALIGAGVLMGAMLLSRGRR